MALSLSCSAAAMHVNNSVINKTFNDEAGESLREFTEADNITTNWEFDRTEKGCKCNATWFVSPLTSSGLCTIVMRLELRVQAHTRKQTH